MDESAQGRVVILEPLSNTLDVSSLEDLGEICVIFGSTNGMQQTPSVFRTADYIKAIQRWLQVNKYDPAVDSFVMAGRLTKLAVAVAAIVRAFPDKEINLLIFDGGSGRYIKRTV